MYSNIAQVSKNPTLLLILLFFFAFFIPPLAFPFLLIVFLISYDIDEKSKLILFGIYILALAFIHFAANSSEGVLLYEESDFVSYYNNYIFFINNGFDSVGFEYSQGLEFGLPLLNYLLSILISEPNPYLLKLIYVFFQVFLLGLLLVTIKRHKSLTGTQFFCLAASVILFLKFGALQNHFRQGVSSLFLLIAIFTDRRKVLPYFILSCSFHLSALVIYPITKAIVMNQKRYPLELFFIAISVCFLIFAPILVSVISYETPVVGKLVWSLLRFANEEYILQSVKISLINIAIFLILLFFSWKNKQYDVIGPLRIVTVFLLTLGFIPGFTRIMSPILLVLTGYYFWLVFAEGAYRKLFKFFLFCFFIVFQWRWITSDLYYYDYRKEGDFIYIYSRIFENYSENEINRRSLPSLEDLTDVQ